VQCSVRNGPLESAAMDFSFTESAVSRETKPERGEQSEQSEQKAADPDDLEAEIAEAEDEGDFKPTHAPRRPLSPKHRRK